MLDVAEAQPVGTKIGKNDLDVGGVENKTNTFSEICCFVQMNKRPKGVVQTFREKFPPSKGQMKHGGLNNQEQNTRGNRVTAFVPGCSA